MPLFLLLPPRKFQVSSTGFFGLLTWKLQELAFDQFET
jgi:hypothetical protein